MEMEIEEEPRSASDLPRILGVLRVSAGKSQAELAEAAKVRQSAISEYEQGRKTPDLATLRRLLAVMGYSLSALDLTAAYLLTLAATLASPGEAITGGTQLGAEQTLMAEAESLAQEVGRATRRLVRFLLLVLLRSRHNSKEGIE